MIESGLSFKFDGSLLPGPGYSEPDEETNGKYNQRMGTHDPQNQSVYCHTSSTCVYYGLSSFVKLLKKITMQRCLFCLILNVRPPMSRRPTGSWPRDKQLILIRVVIASTLVKIEIWKEQLKSQVGASTLSPNKGFKIVGPLSHDGWTFDVVGASSMCRLWWKRMY